MVQHRCIFLNFILKLGHFCVLRKLISKLEGPHNKEVIGQKLSVKDILEGQDGQVIYLVKYKNKTGYVKVGDPENLTLSNRWNELH